MAITGKITGQVAMLDNRDTEFTKLRDNPIVSLAMTFANGTGVDQIDSFWYDRRSLAATTETLDLSGGLTDAFGTAFSFAKVKLLIVKNNNTTAGHTLKIGGNASNQFLLFTDGSDKYTLGPGGIFMVAEPCAAGLAVTAATGDILKMDAGAQTISYDILIAGIHT